MFPIEIISLTGYPLMQQGINKQYLLKELNDYFPFSNIFHTECQMRLRFYLSNSLFCISMQLFLILSLSIILIIFIFFLIFDSK